PYNVESKAYSVFAQSLAEICIMAIYVEALFCAVSQPGNSHGRIDNKPGKLDPGVLRFSLQKIVNNADGGFYIPVEA
ncbi:hypothetical protein NL529_34760, partial [Klebsiella pneumoniae]|nr:hypothetical protein [Klebsiella pneumoniae]